MKSFSRFAPLLIILLSPFRASANSYSARPGDWVSYSTPLRDSRPYHELGQGQNWCRLEVMGLKYSGKRPKVGAVLLVPGLFHDFFVFDLLPEKNISYARYLMNEKGLQVYALHARGIDRSCYPGHSDLHDIAIDDIPEAIRFVADDLGEGKIYVMGHSQGGMTAQASLAGLTRCARGNCFDAPTASERQSRVLAAGILAGGVALSSDEADGSLKQLSLIGKILIPSMALFLDRINATLLTRFLAPTLPFEGPFAPALNDGWEITYHIPNVSDEARVVFYRNALEATTVRALKQFSAAIADGGLRDGTGERYRDFLGNVRVPTAFAAFGLDTLSEPKGSRTDDFDFLGSPQKRFFEYAGEGHEDFMLNGNFHAHQSELIDWLISSAKAGLAAQVQPASAAVISR